MKITTFLMNRVGLRGFIATLLFATQVINAQSVPIYGTTIISQSNTDFSNNATDQNLATRARVRASSGIAFGIGAYSGHLEIQFPSTLPANTTSFIKIQTDDNLLPALLGGSLGKVLSDVLGGVLVGNQEFTIQAKNNNAVVLEGNSQIAADFATSRLRIVTNKTNEYFIAITPDQNYNRIRLTNRVGSLLGLGNTKRLDVYDVFYIGTPDICGGPSYTSYSGSGLNLDLLGLGGAGVTNPHHVLDANPNNFSKLSLGILSVAASIEQTVYFDGVSLPSDQFFIRLKVDPSLLALGIANNIQIVTMSGPTTVQTVNLNSLLNLDLLTLLQGNQVARIPFSPNAAIDRITVRYNSLLNVQLTQSLDLYSITRAPAKPIITDTFTLSPKICSGSAASLVAQTSAATTQLKWYTQSSGGTALATTSSGEPFVTPVLNQNTTYYVATVKTGCTEESERIRINITVVTLPVASNIIIPETMVACSGSVVLTPSSSVGGAEFHYYKDPLKTQEITTGYSGDPGVNYIKSPITGALAITGLNEANSPYEYYIAIRIDGLCENAATTLKKVTVHFSSELELDVTSTLEGCGNVNLKDAIRNFNNSEDITYLFFNAANQPITAEAAAAITTNGVYYIQAVSQSGDCASSTEQVTVTVHPVPVLTVPNTHYALNTNSIVTLEATSNGTIVWYDSQGTALTSNVVGPFTSPGFYSFTAVAVLEGCTVSKTVFITVIDTDACPPLTNRIYPNSQSWGSIITGGVTNATAAIDQNPQTFSTVTTGLGILGIGTTWQTIQWNHTISPGTPVTVKLGSEYSGLTLAGAYSIVGTKRNSSGIPIDIGVIQPVSGTLLNLLPGENIFEYTFIPSDNTGPKAYDGIRIIVGSLVSVAQNVKVFEAYYKTPATAAVCNQNDVEDLYYGVIDLGIGALTTTVGVSDAYNAVDTNVDSYATIFSGAGILAAADLTIAFKTPTLTGDKLEIILSKPGSVLDLNLLSGFVIQPYLGNTPVGNPINNTASILNLTLLNGGQRARLVIHTQNQIYDRVKIRFGGVATVLNFLFVHDIKRTANTAVVGADVTNTVEVCQNDTIELAVGAQDCASFVWYDAPQGGNIVSTGISYTIPGTLIAGTYDYYVQPIRFGCEAYTRGKVSVIVGENAPANAITQVTINNTTTSVICNNSSISLQAIVSTTTTLTNPVFYWYTENNNEITLIHSSANSELVINNPAPGHYIYYVGISTDEYCLTLPQDRYKFEFDILPFSQPTDISVANAVICANNPVTLTPTSSTTNANFFWYFSNDTTQPITNGLLINGVSYSLDSSGVLTITGLQLQDSPFTFYVALTSNETCLNQAGNLKPVLVTITDSGTPTTTATNQQFCLSNSPTIADIQVNESNILWFTEATGGNPLTGTEPLTSGTSYYAGFDASSGCASSVRLEIQVTVNDVPTPTTTDITQDFCVATAPTINDIQVNETNVIWFSALTGGTPLDPSDSLVDGAVYYASLNNVITQCSSSTRLAITVTLSDVQTPSTSSILQNFCATQHPVIGNIQVNESGVIWYDAASGGTVLESTHPLTSGTTYYAALIDTATACESSVRLAVTVTITNVATPSTNATAQEFCWLENPTLENIQVNETNIIWYDQLVAGTPLPATTALQDGNTYYVALVDELTLCESQERLAISVTITNIPTPTTVNTEQSFCLNNGNPTIAQLQVNETDILWYSQATGGTALATTESLVDGTTYYAAITDSDSGCESSVRLAITVHITDTPTPTTNSAMQSFCLSQNPVITDIQVNESGVVWYSQPIGGTILSPTDILIDGTIYYAALLGNGNCESSGRLAITVVVNDVITPTTTNATQAFCSTATPTIANLQINESNVIWYADATGGDPLPLTQLLTSNTIYYAALLGNGNCESTTRLPITVIFSDGSSTTITGKYEDVCVFEEVTYSTLANMNNYQWTVSNGVIVSGGSAVDNSVTIRWTTMGNHTVNVSYTDNCNVLNNASLTVTITTCSDITISKIVDNPTPKVGESVNFLITVNNVGIGQFQNIEVSENIPSGYAFEQAVPSIGIYNQNTGIWTIPVLNANESATLLVTVRVLSNGNYVNIASIIISNPIDIDTGNNRAEAIVFPVCLTVYNEFSPNGDGANESFIIDCIENYPNNKLEIYNRYGKLVYSKNKYANDWDGTANVSGAVSKNEQLPAGTYYYVLDVGANGIIKTGWLAITR